MSIENKDMMSFKDCIATMNPAYYADAPVNCYGMVDLNKDGTRPWGMRYKVSEHKFGVLAGRSLNPLIYRGENKEYEHFLPSVRRGEYIDSDRIRKEQFLSVYKETPYYQYGKNYTDSFGYHMELDLEAVAQHYGFKTDYLDITRLREVAEFFAYTYCDKEGYHPITDFTEYCPCVYTADLHDIYNYNPHSLKMISGQIALRPCVQGAMAIIQSYDCKSLFHKEILPRDPHRSREIFERRHTYLFPNQDVLSEIANTILMEDKIDYSTRLYFVMGGDGKIDRSYNKSTSNNETRDSLDLKIKKIMKDDVEMIFRPLLAETGHRECTRSL